jgi:hypothetical protein
MFGAREACWACAINVELQTATSAAVVRSRRFSTLASVQGNSVEERYGVGWSFEGRFAAKRRNGAGKQPPPLSMPSTKSPLITPLITPVITPFITLFTTPFISLFISTQWIFNQRSPDPC